MQINHFLNAPIADKTTKVNQIEKLWEQISETRLEQQHFIQLEQQLSEEDEELKREYKSTVNSKRHNMKCQRITGKEINFARPRNMIVISIQLEQKFFF